MTHVYIICESIINCFGNKMFLFMPIKLFEFDIMGISSTVLIHFKLTCSNSIYIDKDLYLYH